MTKIVQYQNGKYGIRRFNFFIMDYEFLGKTYRGKWVDYWWPYEYREHRHEFDTYDAAATYVTFATRAVKRDIGTTITNKGN